MPTSNGNLMDFLDFELRITEGADKAYSVAVHPPYAARAFRCHGGARGDLESNAQGSQTRDTQIALDAVDAK